MFVLLLWLWALLTSVAVPTAVAVLNAPTTEAERTVYATLEGLPPQDVALIDEVWFAPADGEGMVYPDACGEAWTGHRRIVVRAVDICLDGPGWLAHIIAHELGHFTDHAADWQRSYVPGCTLVDPAKWAHFCPVEAERWAEQYAAAYGF